MNDEDELELDQMAALAKPILTNDQLDTLVQGILSDWARQYPVEVKAAMRYVHDLKERHHGNPTGRTKHGNVLGAFPQYVADRLSTMLNDPNWMTNNPKIIGMVFKHFEVGRVAYWEGRGKGGTSGRLTLNDADSR